LKFVLEKNNTKFKMIDIFAKKSSVAIIGSGMAGLVSAKYALENGLVLFVFEKCATIGDDFWSLSSNKKFEGLIKNVSIYREMFSDLLWPKNTQMFPSEIELNFYLNQYVKKFLLKEHIYLEQEVVLARQNLSNKWEIISKNSKTLEEKYELFDYLIVTTGEYSEPFTPHVKNSKDFKGIQMYNSEFKQNDSRLDTKNVAVVKKSIYITNLP
jgi:cation diffusion facilitator CzcD-associated flavoprotein CzcO